MFTDLFYLSALVNKVFLFVVEQHTAVKGREGEHDPFYVFLLSDGDDLCKMAKFSLVRFAQNHK